MCSRAIRTAFSIASAPPLVKNTFVEVAGRQLGDQPGRLGPRVVGVLRRDVHSRAACSWIAATTFGCWWPMLTLTSCEEKSR